MSASLRRPAFWLASLTVSIALAGCAESDAPTFGVSSGTSLKDLLPYERGEGTGVLHEYDMYVDDDATCRYSPHEGKELSCFAFHFEGEPWSIPGPEIRVRQGDTLRVTLHTDNDAVFHTMHWHGVSVPFEMDGVPFVTQDMGTLGTPTEYTYEFQAFEAGTYWYHCHVEAPSHIDAGMFGALIVEPADPSKEIAYDREAVMFLHEVDSAAIEPFGAFSGDVPTVDDIPQNPMDAALWGYQYGRTGVDALGFFLGDGFGGPYLTTEGPRDHYPASSIRYRPMYDTFMINGKSFPETEPVFLSEGETLRMRLINAGQNIHTMHLHGHHFLVTHRDGYPLPEPFWADSLPIGPGGRYDVYVYGDNPGIWDFHDHGGGTLMGGFASNDFAFPGGMATFLVYEDFEHGAAASRGAQAADFVVHAPSFDP